MIKTLDSLIKIWLNSQEFHSFNNGATEQELEIAENILGYRLPEDLRQLYSFSNGLELLRGNVQIYPLEEQNGYLGLTTASEKLRQWEWPIPNQLIMFGDNGSDDLYGIWIPYCNNPTYAHPVIEIGEIFEPGCMAIAGTGLIPFLVSQTAFYLQLLEAKSTLLDTMELPLSLRFDDFDEKKIAQIRKWADANIPNPLSDPYTEKLTIESLNHLFLF